MLCAGAVAIAGCGGSSQPSVTAFRSGFETDRAQFHRLSLDLESAIAGAHTKTNAQLAAELSALSGRSAMQATRLSKLHPPAKYKPDLEKLVAGFRAVAADLTRISQAATSGDAKTASAATRSLIAHAKTVRAADLGVSNSLGG